MFLIFCGCKKKDKEETPYPINEMAGFEIVCTGCSIYYTTPDGHEITVENVRLAFTQKYEPQQYFYVYVSRASSYSFKLILNERAVFHSEYTSANPFRYDGKRKIFSDSFEIVSYGNSPFCSHNGRALASSGEKCFYYKEDRQTKVFVDKSECECNMAN